MAKGISLHVGLNRVDPKAYDGWDGKLECCHSDAKDMQALAKRNKFETELLLDKEATVENIHKRFSLAAQKLRPNDIFLFTYSGHGTQVPDLNDDEIDGQDEAWVLFDGLLLDDMIGRLSDQFRDNVRVLIISDSCHSGTICRSPNEPQAANNSLTGIRFVPFSRFSPKIIDREIYHHRGRLSKEGASVISLSACQDNQFAYESNGNGLFTAALKQVVFGDDFKGSYYQLLKSIAKKMPANQSPKYRFGGPEHDTFSSEQVFTINPLGNENELPPEHLIEMRRMVGEVTNRLDRIEKKLENINPEVIGAMMNEFMMIQKMLHQHEGRDPNAG